MPSASPTAATPGTAQPPSDSRVSAGIGSPARKNCQQEHSATFLIGPIDESEVPDAIAPPASQLARECLTVSPCRCLGLELNTLIALSTLPLIFLSIRMTVFRNSGVGAKDPPLYVMGASGSLAVDGRIMCRPRWVPYTHETRVSESYQSKAILSGPQPNTNYQSHPSQQRCQAEEAAEHRIRPEPLDRTSGRLRCWRLLHPPCHTRWRFSG
jgi:hypothetical protein